MSKVKITGHASGSGTLTLTGPNTNSDRTITLPDSTGTVLTLAGGAMTGTLTNFTSTGIDDNADATAITIDSSENVGIGTTTPSNTFVVNKDKSGSWIAVLGNTNSSNGYGVKVQGGDSSSGNVAFRVTDYNDTSVLDVKADGRGLSQFTAKAWINYRGMSTNSIRDSHNVSSVTDDGIGKYTVNFTNSLANNNYAWMTGGDGQHTLTSNREQTTSLAKIYCFNTDDSWTDHAEICAVAFGD